ncbi:MAG: DnaJ domain-containing protein [Azonexus sp.]
MAKTLYDLLEVSQTASAESIAASYRRLQAAQAALVGDPQCGEDATNQLIALREAYATLSDPARRQAYDARLATRTIEASSAEPAVSPRLRLAMLAGLIAACGLGYAKFQADREKAALEREQAAAAAAIRQAEIAAQQEREQAERERLAAREAEYQRLREEARARLEQERNLAYGRQVSRDVQRAELQAERERLREVQRQEQERLREEQQRLYEAERRLAQDKATLRRIEAENARYPRF